MLPKKITVLYPILHYPPVIGGLEQWTQNIAERQSQDVRIIVVTGRVKGAPNFETKNNVTIVRTSLFSLQDLSHSSILYIASAVPFIALRSFLLAKNIDIFHCHGFVSALMGYFISIFVRRPLIGTEQSIIWNNPISRLASAVIYRRARLCIASSRSVGEGFAKLGVKNIEIIPNGVDLEKFTTKDQCARCGKWDFPHKEFAVLSVGRLEKVKGHKYLIEAFAILKKELRNAKLTLVGDGSERRNLEGQAEKLGVKNSVQFVGAMRHDDLPHYYHIADVFVMPSLSEGFGITAIEAMACGLPVVVSGTGGLLDIVEDKVTGFLSGPGDHVSLKSHILNILQDKDLQKTISNNAKCRAREYSWNNIAKRVNNIYKLQCECFL